MTEAFSGQSYLFQWCDAAQCPADVRAYDTRSVKRQLGDWWKNGNTWCLHLDDWHYADFGRAPELDERLRQTLALYLEAVAQPSAPTWRACVMSWLHDLSGRSTAELFHALLEHQTLPPQSSGMPPMPGYLIWLHFGSQSQRTQLTADMKAAVTEIIEAFSPEGLIGWDSGDTASSSALLYWYTTDDDQADVEDKDQSAGPYMPIRQAVEQLLHAINADAMATASAAIGVPVRSPQSLFHGLATAVAAWRSREWFHQPGRVWVWGEQPLTVVLQAIDDASASLFIEVAAQRAPAQSLVLPDDLNEALQGLIAANLNVSEASRLLYLHRNTLMNRLERIRQSTGYDIRIFNDALVLWIANLLQKSWLN